MRDFFLNYNNDFAITLFSKYHILLIVLTFLIVGLVIYKRNFFRNLSDKTKKSIRVIFAIILIFNLVVRRGSFLYYGVYNWHYHLDINFCNFTNILFIIYGLTENKNVFNLCSHMAFVGPLLSIIFPSVNINPYNYSFYSFILIHHIVFIFNFIFIFMNNYNFNHYSLVKVNKFIFTYHLIIYFFDYLFGLNYNFPTSFINSSFFSVVLFDSDIEPLVFIIYVLIICLLLTIANYIIKRFNIQV